MIEISLLKTLSNRSNLDKYIKFINPKTLSTQSLLLLKDYQAYFATRDIDQIDFGEFKTFFFIEKHSSFDDKLVAEYKSIFDKIEFDNNEDEAKNIVTAFERQELYDILHNDLDNNIEPKILLEKVQQHIERHEQLDKDDKALLETMDLHTSLDFTDRSHGLLWRLKTLQDHFQGGLITGDFGIIGGYTDCYDDQTEILTDSGWKLFKDLQPKDLVMQDNNGELSLVKPLRYITKDYAGVMYKFFDRFNRINLVVTPNHRMLRVNKKGAYVESLAKELNPSSLYDWKTSGHITGPGELTAYERFLIAYQADGSKSRKGCTGERGHFTVRLGFTKQCKIDRMRTILNSAGLVYKEVIREKRPDYTTFYVQVKEHPLKTFEWVDLKTMSTERARLFINEVRHWSPSSFNNPNAFRYITTVKINADVVQSIAFIAGYTTNLGIREDKRSELFSTAYDTNIMINKSKSGERQIIKKEIDYKGKVYCVQVPSGFIVVRRNNKAVVSGNCGKTSFLCSEITCMAQQLKDDQWIAWFNTEGSWQQIVPRIYQASLNCTVSDLKKWPDKAASKYIEMMKGDVNRIRVINAQRKSTRDIENIIKKNPPSLIIFDLLDHIQGFNNLLGKEGNTTERYGALYQWARTVATEYCPVLAISQLNGDGNDSEYPSITSLRGSRVDKQAAATFQLIIGSREGDNNTRYLSMPKNKISSNKSWRAVVSFDPVRSRFSD